MRQESLLPSLIDETLILRDETLHCRGGGGGAGARENRGQEGYWRRERKGREAGVLRGREAGEKCEALFF